MTPAAWCALEDLSSLRFEGADAARFLQGQLSSDLNLLRPGRIQRAGLHNPQGRTLALLWLAQAADQVIHAFLPTELAAAITAQLRRYVLRSKVTISDQTAHSRLIGFCGAGADAVPGGWMLDADRAVALLARDDAAPGGPRWTREQWQAIDVARGLPQIHAATSGLFVAQMLNLDCVEAVSFDKGCYTGQEVIARAHFRGRVKRRMQRFGLLRAIPLAPGDAGRLEDGRSFRVIESVALPDGSMEFLAVAPLPTAGSKEATDAEEAALPVGGALAAPLQVRPLPLPYPLPQ